MLDYQDLLEREKSSQVFVPLPPRPSSSLSTGSSDSAAASRKHKQKMLLATKAANRPHTSSARVRTCSTPNGALSMGDRRSAGAVRSSRSPSIPLRAQTAGAIPHLSEVPNTDNNARLKENSCDAEQEVRGTTPVTVHVREAKDRLESVPSSLFRHVAGSGNEDLFHFPQADSGAA